MEVVEEVVGEATCNSVVVSIPLSSEVCTDWEKVVMGTKGGSLVTSGATSEWAHPFRRVAVPRQPRASELGGEKVRGLWGVGEDEEWQLPGDSCMDEFGVMQQPLSVSDKVLS